MRNLALSILSLALITSCSTVPSEPKPHKTKYAIQVIELHLSDALPVEITPEDVEKAITSSDAVILEYPVVYASLDESAVVDQTEQVSFPYDFAIVDGKAVGIEKNIKIGKFVEVVVTNQMTLKSADADLPDALVMDRGNSILIKKLHTYHRELVGYNTHKLNDQIEVKVPFFSKREVNTGIVLQPDTWVTIGGFPESKSEVHKYVCVRGFPPKSKQ